MANVNDLFPSNYMKAGADVPEGHELTLTCDAVTMEKLGDDEKPVLSFSDYDKSLVLNKTNANTIAGMYGAQTEKWRGRKVTLIHQWVDFQGRMVEGLRVKPRVPQQATAAQQPDDFPLDPIEEEAPF